MLHMCQHYPLRLLLRSMLDTFRLSLWVSACSSDEKESMNIVFATLKMFLCLFEAVKNDILSSV